MLGPRVGVDIFLSHLLGLLLFSICVVCQSVISGLVKYLVPKRTLSPNRVLLENCDFLCKKLFENIVVLPELHPGKVKF